MGLLHIRTLHRSRLERSGKILHRTREMNKQIEIGDICYLIPYGEHPPRCGRVVKIELAEPPRYLVQELFDQGVQTWFRADEIAKLYSTLEVSKMIGLETNHTINLLYSLGKTIQWRLRNNTPAYWRVTEEDIEKIKNRRKGSIPLQGRPPEDKFAIHPEVMGLLFPHPITRLK